MVLQQLSIFLCSFGKHDLKMMLSVSPQCFTSLTTPKRPYKAIKNFELAR